MRNLLLVVAFTLAASPVFAQTGLSGPMGSIEISPQYPEPGQRVVATLISSFLNLNEHSVSWRTDNGSLASDGEARIEVIAPSAGETLNLYATIDGEDSGITASISSASVDLLWETDTYAPPLYRGRHLPSLGSTITLLAIPHIANGAKSEFLSKDIIYTWKQNDKVLGSRSGKGRSSITLPASVFSKTDTYTVIATTPDRSRGAQATAIIDSSDPVTRLYIDHPLYGTLYNNALLSTTRIPTNEMSFMAVPFSSSATSPYDARMIYAWRVNGVTIQPNTARPSVLTINASKSSGQARIDLTVTHKQDYLFETIGSWAVSFEQLGLDGAGADPFGR